MHGRMKMLTLPISPKFDGGLMELKEFIPYTKTLDTRSVIIGRKDFLTTLPPELVLSIAVHLHPNQILTLLTVSKRTQTWRPLLTSFTFAHSNLTHIRLLPNFTECDLNLDILGPSYLAATLYHHGSSSYFAMYCLEKEKSCRVFLPCERHCGKLKKAYEYLIEKFGSETMRRVWNVKSWEIPQLARLNLPTFLNDVLNDFAAQPESTLCKLDITDAFHIACAYGFTEIVKRVSGKEGGYRGDAVEGWRVDPACNGNYLLRMAFVRGDDGVVGVMKGDKRVAADLKFELGYGDMKETFGG
ncbi:hypothetical protein BC829DRAFT_420327 [Chytridium lagenaria]|nr:hypothetical protein BC829DRAFT_420327 [Chytridium lagenaria]